MDDIARMPAAELKELFTEAANRYGSTPEVMEKDFWVTWTLSTSSTSAPPPPSASRATSLLERPPAFSQNSLFSYSGK
jgi:hypothetical protein